MDRVAYMIEHTDTHAWWDGIGWTLDPHCAKQFDTQDLAEEYVGGHPFYGHEDATVTEHMFMATPFSTPHVNN